MLAFITLKCLSILAPLAIIAKHKPSTVVKLRSKIFILVQRLIEKKGCIVKEIGMAAVGKIGDMKKKPPYPMLPLLQILIHIICALSSQNKLGKEAFSNET